MNTWPLQFCLLYKHDSQKSSRLTLFSYGSWLSEISSSLALPSFSMFSSRIPSDTDIFRYMLIQSQSTHPPIISLPNFPSSILSLKHGALSFRTPQTWNFGTRETNSSPLKIDKLFTSCPFWDWINFQLASC